MSRYTTFNNSHSRNQQKGREEESEMYDDILQVFTQMKKEGSRFIRNIVLTPDEYLVTAYSDAELNDTETFCVNGNNVLLLDTTFDVCDMWLSDTAYQNRRLVNDKLKHLWFFGPILFHMKKTPETFSRFCMDLVASKAEIRKLPILGTDLEKALFQGFKVIIPTMQSLLCVKHMSERDQKKLTSLKAAVQKEIIADIYGPNDGYTRKLRLASAEDEEDFKIKLFSLKDKWEELAPSFHDWFSTRRASQFIDSVIQSARDGTSIDGLFYNNAIESLHSILKGEIGDEKLNVLGVIQRIKIIIQRKRREEIRAIYQTGLYRLSPEYKHFQVKRIHISDNA